MSTGGQRPVPRTARCARRSRGWSSRRSRARPPGRSGGSSPPPLSELPVSIPVAPTTQPLGTVMRDVVHAVVGEELGLGVELVTVPAGVLEHAELREPLRDEEVVADRAGAIERARHACRPLHDNRDRLTWRDRAWKGHDHHRTVIRIPIVGSDEASRRREIAGWHRQDRHPQAGSSRPSCAKSPGGLWRPPERARSRISVDLRIDPRIPVQVELQFAGRHVRDVAPGDHFRRGDRARARLEADVDRVVRVARGESALRWSARSVDAAGAASAAPHTAMSAARSPMRRC